MKKIMFAIVCVLVVGFAGCGSAPRYDASHPESITKVLKGESETNQRLIMFLMSWMDKEEKQQFNGMTAKEIIAWGEKRAKH